MLSREILPFGQRENFFDTRSSEESSTSLDSKFRVVENVLSGFFVNFLCSKKLCFEMIQQGSVLSRKRRHLLTFLCLEFENLCCSPRKALDLS